MRRIEALGTWPLTPFAASIWALGHGGMSLYWALGGTAGVGLLVEQLQTAAELREPAFIALLWGVALAKLAAGLLAYLMSYTTRIGSVRARLAILLVAAGGIGMTLYGLAGLVACALNFLGVIGSAETRDPALIWFLVLWYPLWLLGGILFSLAALRGRALHLHRVHRAASGALTSA